MLQAGALPANGDHGVALMAVRLPPQNQLRPAEAGPNVVPPTVPDPPDRVDQPS